MALYELFLLGSWGFWVTACVFAAIAIALIENRKAIVATVILLIAGFLYCKFWHVRATEGFRWLMNHPSAIFGAAFVSIIVGIIYSFIKWGSFLSNTKDEILEKKEDLIEKYNIDEKTEIGRLEIALALRSSDDGYAVDNLGHMRTTLVGQHHSGRKRVPDQFAEQWLSHLRTLEFKSLTPKAKDHKSDIITWIIYWPFSLVWFIIDDPMKRLGKFLYRLLGSLYDNVAKKMFASLEVKE
jgi:hypothetical protein